MLQLSVKNNKLGRQNYLSLDEESYMAAASYIEGSHGLPIGTTLISAELLSVVESVKEIPTCKYIDPQYALEYCCTFVKGVSVSE